MGNSRILIRKGKIRLIVYLFFYINIESDALQLSKMFASAIDLTMNQLCSTSFILYRFSSKKTGMVTKPELKGE